MSLHRHSSQSAPRPFPSGRYVRTNPLLRLFGLQLLAEPLPKALGATLIRIWLGRSHYNGNQAIQSLYRERPDKALLPYIAPALLRMMMQIELEVARRMVEIPRTEITSEWRSALLRLQGAYLCAIYAALASHWGEAAALAEFERPLLAVG